MLIDYLNKAPGIFSSRWAPNNNYNNAFNKIKNLLKDKGLNINGQSAKFVCVIALIDKNKKEFIFKSSLNGTLAYPPRGKNGFGYDPIFIPLMYEKTLAEMGPEKKNSLSHRKKALDQLIKSIIFKKTFIL